MTSRAIQPRSDRSHRSRRARSSRKAKASQPITLGEVRMLRARSRVRRAITCLVHGNRETSVGAGGHGEPQAGAGRQKAQPAAVLRGVGRAHSTDLREVGEDVGNARRVDGGKGRGQRKTCSAKRVPGSGRARRAHCQSPPSWGQIPRFSPTSLDQPPTAGVVPSPLCASAGPDGAESEVPVPCPVVRRIAEMRSTCTRPRFGANSTSATASSATFR